MSATGTRGSPRISSCVLGSRLRALAESTAFLLQRGMTSDLRPIVDAERVSDMFVELLSAASEAEPARWPSSSQPYQPT